MKKMSVGDAALELGITKEAIYNRIRRGSIQSVLEGDERYIMIDEKLAPKSNNTNKQTAVFKEKATVPDERYINLLVSQIEELKSANSELNKDKERLIREKEQLLIEQKITLQAIYKERDEQLKAILTLANRSLLANPQERMDKLTIEANCEQPSNAYLENEQQLDKNVFTDWRELKSYLKAKGFSKKKKKKIVSHAKEFVGIDGDVQEDEGVLYVKKDKIEQFI